MNAAALSAAGLGCPDWPGCYGQLLGVPQSPAEVSIADRRQPFDFGKAWREIAHRYIAGLGCQIGRAVMGSHKQLLKVSKIG